MGPVMRSARAPLIAIALVWASYAGFRIVRSTPDETPIETASLDPNPPHPPLVARPPEASVAIEAEADAARGADPETAAVPAKEAVAPNPLRSEDEELLEILRGPSEDLDDRLRAFIEKYPDHTAARALLVLQLLAEEPRSPEIDDEIRAHAQLLRQIVPDKGLPDLALARLEAGAGRIELGRQYLFEAMAKDLSWSPDSELMRMRIEADLAAGRPSYKSLANALNTILPSCMGARNLMRSFLYTEDEKGEDVPMPPPADPAALDLHRRTARALLQVGKAIQQDGLVLVQNLVGSAVLNGACRALEQTGDLAPEEEALRERTKAIQSEARLFTHLVEEILFSDPVLMTDYLRDLAAYGERRAGRRAMMTYLGRDPAE